MEIKHIEVLESKLDQVDGEQVVKVILQIEVQDASHTSYITEHEVLTIPILSWETITHEDLVKSVKKNLKGRSF